MMKQKLAVMILSVILGFTGATYIADAKETETDGKMIQEGIAKEILRFHVLANSDSEEDQELKLKVKDAIVIYLKDVLEGSVDLAETKARVSAHMDEILQVAEETINAEGYHYEVTGAVKKLYFPMKTYGDCTFPPGEYEALRIEIGAAKGKNWWCVLYPNLCFVDAAHAVVPDEEKQELKNVLTEEEYDEIIQNPDKVKVKFGFFTFLNKK